MNKVFGILLVWIMLSAVNVSVWAKNWNTENGQQSELHTRLGKCEPSAVECLDIDGFEMVISIKKPGKPNALHLFITKDHKFSCPNGYTIFEEGNMIAEHVTYSDFISVCGMATDSVMSRNFSASNRLRFFQGGICPNGLEKIFWTEKVVGCGNKAPPVARFIINKAKSTCTELGFTAGTKKFGECVLKMMDN